MTTRLEIEAARYRLGLQTGSDLARVALDAVVAGLDSPHLIRLSGEVDPILSDAAPWFERALDELSVAIPPKDEAGWIVLRHHLTQIVDGRVAARAGVKTIVNEVVDPCDLHERSARYLGDSHDLQDLLGAFYGFDDLEERPEEVSCDGRYGPEAISALEAHIVDLAAVWLRKHGA